MKHAILVLNAGSSSLKFSLFGVDNHQFTLINKGLIDGLGLHPHFTIKNNDDQKVLDEALKIDENSAVSQHEQGLQQLLAWIEANVKDVEIIAVGHRVVHGGETYGKPTKITPEVFTALDSLTSLAPLHQPHNLNPVKIMEKLRGDLPQVACFDTAFHRTQPKVAQTFAIPKELTDKGIKRYGFHGLSYHYISTVLSDYVDEKIAKGRVIIAHLGNGASMCGIKNGESQVSTMGFTAIEGLPMGTRCGQLDAGVVLHLIDHENMSVKDVTNVLYKKSGLLGLSGGISSDMRDLIANGSNDAHNAIDVFSYQIARQAGAISVDLGGVDAIVFTGGIGEKASIVRQKVCDYLAFMGLEIDQNANNASNTEISTASSKIKALVIPTNEELMIAKQTADILKLI